MGHEAPAFALVQSAEASADAVVRTVLSGTAGVGKPGHCRLGLAELPERIDRLASGMVYGLACDQQAVRLPLIANAILASLRNGRRCALLAASDPAVLLRKLRLAGFALEAPLKRGELDVFEVTRDAAKQLFRIGAESLLAELDKNIPAREVFVVLDEADALFQVADLSAGMEATQRYVHWAAERNHTLLPVFTPAPQAPRDYLNLRRMAETFGGFGLAKPASGGALLEIRHWFGPEGASARESFELRLHGGSARACVDPAVPAAEDLPPIDGVICARGALGSAGSAKGCENVATYDEALDAARRSDNARLVLPYQSGSDFAPLCRVLTAVRALGRPGLRVLVRERARLRAGEALALLRLGVSSIIPVDLADAAAKRVADALQGTRFARPYDSDLEQVLADTTVALAERPQNARAFCEALERLLAAADGFDVPSTLARLEGVQIEPARMLACARRNGREIVGFWRERTVWLYLFGCPADAAPDVLQRLFIAPPADICSRWEIQHEPEGILSALRALRSR